MSQKPSKPVLWIGRILSLLVVLLLLMGATMALTSNKQAQEGMVQFGYPPNMLVTLGIVELACAILYLIPQTAVLGAILVTAYLGGATATHVRMSDPAFIVPPIVGVVVWLGLLLREPRLRPLLPIRF